MDRLDGMEPVIQLALKAINDPSNYDRPRVNELRRRAPESITEDEVLAARIKLMQQADGMLPFPKWTW